MAVLLSTVLWVQASHAGGNHCHTKTMITSTEETCFGESSEVLSENNNMRISEGQHGEICFLQTVTIVCQDFFLFFQLFQFMECVFLCTCVGVTSKKGQHFNSEEMRRGEKMGNKKNCQQHKMAVVIRLSPGL